MNYAQFVIHTGDDVITNMGVRGKVVKMVRQYYCLIKVDGSNELYTASVKECRKVMKGVND